MARISFVSLIGMSLLALVLAACKSGGASSTPSFSSSASPADEPTAGGPTPSPTPYPLPPLTPFPSHLSEQIDQIARRVAQVRGLPVASLEKKGILDLESARQYYLDSLANLPPDEAADADAAERVMQMLGLVPEGYSLENLYSDLAGNIAGFYSTEEDTFVVVGDVVDEITISQELTIAHELTHAMQDEMWDLDAWQNQYKDYPSDVEGYTAYEDMLSCVFEADASLTEELYAEEVYGEEWRDLALAQYDEAEIAAIQAAAGGLPPFVRDSFYFNYDQCQTFIEQVYEDGGWSAINDLYTDPPATQEQVLDYDAFLAGEIAKVPAPAGLDSKLPGWTEGPGSGQFGDFDAGSYIRALSGETNFLGSLYGYFGSIGWDSGWVRYYTNPTDEDITVVQMSLSFETNDDRTMFLSAFGPIAAGFGAPLDAPSTEDIFGFDGEPPIQPGQTVEWADGPSAGPYGSITVYREALGLDIFVATDAETIDLVSP
jgi:hypothetical protein